MQQYYNGIESVLTRICKFRGVEPPQGSRFHIELLTLFGPDHPKSLPRLLDDDLFDELEPFRQFRHVFRTAYSFQLDWSRFYPGARLAEPLLDRFESAVWDAVESFG